MRLVHQIPIYGISDVDHNRHLVQERLPVDLATLCTIMERLFGLAIMTARNRGFGSLHGVLLPRTWILALWEDFLGFKHRRLAPSWDLNLIQVTEKLLKDIYTGEYLRDSILWYHSEFYWLYNLHRVTLCSTTGSQEQDT